MVSVPQPMPFNNLLAGRCVLIVWRKVKKSLTWGCTALVLWATAMTWNIGKALDLSCFLPWDFGTH